MENLIYLIIFLVIIWIIWTKYLIDKPQNVIKEKSKNKKQIIDHLTVDSNKIKPIDKFFISIYQFKILSPMNFNKAYQETIKTLKLCDKVINSNDNSCGVTIEQINTAKNNAISSLEYIYRSVDSCTSHNKLEQAIIFLNKILNKKISLAKDSCEKAIDEQPYNIYVKKLSIGPDPSNKHDDISELFEKF